MKVFLLFSILLIGAVNGQNTTVKTTTTTKTTKTTTGHLENTTPAIEFTTFFGVQPSQSIILFFTASWCGPCQQIKPLVEEKAEEYKDILPILIINVDECDPKDCQDFSVSSVPTFILITNEALKGTFIGNNTEKFEQMIEKALH